MTPTTMTQEKDTVTGNRENYKRTHDTNNILIPTGDAFGEYYPGSSITDKLAEIANNHPAANKYTLG